MTEFKMWFDKQEIKEKADCLDIAKNLLGLKLNSKDRCAAIWRGGTNDMSVQVNKDGFYDHGIKAGGDVIKLVEVAEGINFVEADDKLGEYLGLERVDKGKLQMEPPTVNRPKKKVYEFICHDLEGNPRHKEERYNFIDEEGNYILKDNKIEKTFSQLRCEDGKWFDKLEKDGIKIERFPYNLKGIEKQPTILLHEGLKCADVCNTFGFPSTSFVQGTSAWYPEYAQYFKDKNVIIVADNDDPGKTSAKDIARALKDTAKAVKIITVSEWPKGDFVDFVDNGGTKEQLIKIIKKAKPEKLEFLQTPIATGINETIEKAKRLNKEPFKNFCYKMYEDPGSGTEKKYIAPREVNQMIQDLNDRLLGFPRVLGDELFDFDKDQYKVNFFHRPEDLFAWIALKTKHIANFKAGTTVMGKREFFSSLMQASQSYDGLSMTAEYPHRSNKFYAHPPMPDPSKGHAYFNKLVDYFCPATPADKFLIKSLFASAIYGRRGVKMPIWIIDSNNDINNKDEGRGIGKSTLAEMVAYTVGGSDYESNQVLKIERKMLQNETTLLGLKKQILSGEGRRKKIALLDNVKHNFESEVFSDWTTQSSFSGMAPYGYGETTRENDITFIITSNAATFEKDILDRAVMIHLSRPTKAIPNWETNIRKFIEDNRQQIIADIIDVMKDGPPFKAECKLRNKQWEQEVLMPVVEIEGSHTYVTGVINERKPARETESEEGEELEEFISERMAGMGYHPDTNFYWIKGTVLKEWTQECIRGFGGFGGRNYRAKIVSLVKTNALKNIAIPFEKYPHNRSVLGKPKRGFLWMPDGQEWDNNKQIQDIIIKSNN